MWRINSRLKRILYCSACLLDSLMISLGWLKYPLTRCPSLRFFQFNKTFFTSLNTNGEGLQASDYKVSLICSPVVKVQHPVSIHYWQEWSIADWKNWENPSVEPRKCLNFHSCSLNHKICFHTTQSKPHSKLDTGFWLRHIIFIQNTF